jgi:hypothetical protein
MYIWVHAFNVHAYNHVFMWYLRSSLSVSVYVFGADRGTYLQAYCRQVAALRCLSRRILTRLGSIGVGSKSMT